jgi:hypothetical protein
LNNHRKTIHMKSIIASVCMFLVLFLSSCQIVGDIFKAGMIWGIILVVGFIGLIIWVIAKIGGGNK